MTDPTRNGHTLEQDFEHFCAHTGLNSASETSIARAKHRMAMEWARKGFEAAWEPDMPADDWFEEALSLVSKYLLSAGSPKALPDAWNQLEAHLRKRVAQPAQAVGAEVSAFIQDCASFEGQMVNGNRLSTRARTLLGVIAPAPVEGESVTDAMVDAYLKAQGEKVQEVDAQWGGKTGKAPSHLHPVREACRAGLVAALAAQAKKGGAA